MTEYYQCTESIYKRKLCEKVLEIFGILIKVYLPKLTLVISEQKTSLASGN